MQTVPALQQSTGYSQNSVTPDLLQSRMKMLFSAYRLDQYPDAEGFMAQAALVLGQFPADVVLHVTDPRTGIQRTSKFPPTISELTDACEARMQAIARENEIAAWHERKRKSDLLKAAGVKEKPRQGGMTYGEFLKRCEAQKIEPRPIGRFERKA